MTQPLPFRRDVSKINTKHPLYGRPQSFAQKFSAQINFVVFRLKGLQGSTSQLTNVFSGTGEVEREAKRKLGEDNYAKYQSLVDRTYLLEDDAKVLAAEWKEFNQNKGAL